MAYDRSAIDAQRKMNNLAPLTDAEWDALTVNEKPVVVEDAKKKEEEESRIKEQLEADRKKAEEESRKNEKPPIESKELTDEELMEQIERRSGRKVSSWDDLKPKAAEVDEVTKREERDADKLSWGLKTKKFKQKDLENYITDSKDPQGLVYRLQLQEAQKENPALTEAEFKVEFDEEFGLDQDKGSRRYKNGQSSLNRIAKDILSASYSSILNLESDYSQHERQQIANQQREQKIREGIKPYEQTLSKVRADLKKMTVSVDENDVYEVELEQGPIDEAIEMLRNKDYAAGNILNGYTYEQLLQTAQTIVLKGSFNSIAKEVKKQALLRHSGGTKNVFKTEHSREDNQGVELNEAWQTYKNLSEAENSKAAAAN